MSKESFDIESIDDKIQEIIDRHPGDAPMPQEDFDDSVEEIGRASCRERV